MGLCSFKMVDNTVVAVMKVVNVVKPAVEKEAVSEAEAVEMDGWFGDEEVVPTKSK